MTRWITETKRIYVSDVGSVWREVEEGWYAKTRLTKIHYGPFRIRKDAQIFLEQVADIDNKSFSSRIKYAHQMSKVAMKVGMPDWSGPSGI